jgi:C4-dicarboxylate transporter DctQ subunit
MRATVLSGSTRNGPVARVRLDHLQNGIALVSRGVEFALLGACGLLLVLLTINVFLEVVTRYVISMPLPWTEELARFALVWFGMMAAAAAARKGLHFSFRWGVMVLGNRARRALRFAVNVLVIAFLILLFKQSYDFLDIVADQTATASEISMRIPYAGLPVGIAALLLVYILEVADAILSLWTGRCLSLKEALEEETFQQLKHPEEVLSRSLPSAE